MGFATLAATTLSNSSEVPSVSDTIDQVSDATKLINQYGPTVVIIAVFLIVFIGLLFFILRSNHKMNEQMIEAQKAASKANQKMMQDMFDTFKSLVTKDRKTENEDDNEDEERPKKKKIVSAYIDSSLAFKDASRIAIGKIKCERIAIYLFHNGNHTPYGYPFAKMSCVHEWTLRGSNTIRGATHVNIPLYAFSNIVEALVKDGEFVIGNIYDHGIISADEQVFQFISGSTIRALFALGIKDKDGDLAAFTIAEFKDPQDFSDEEVYKNVKDALSTMNDSIYSIIVNDEFRNSYADKDSDSSD